ncbi:unnamed protein product [Cuscuta campestris]|uniref:DUF4283 domain-containing protein n=1 Tax=Cuscuta campestris TaxID=132261 RepID=A0A484LPQ9_9ASTE|nr:unnamed protein product [Cuscuta campestris]
MSDNNHNLTLCSILDKDKLTDSNFLDWQRNLVIVLRLEKKEYVLERAIPPVPSANASRAIKDTYEKHVDDDNQVACLMLATMTSDLQKHHESMKAYDMIIHLKQLSQGQAMKHPNPSRTELATDLILQSLPELYKQFVVNYEMHELDKPLLELLKMLQTAEESLTKGKGNCVLLVQGVKGKKKFKKAKKNGPKGKGNTEPKSNSSKLNLKLVIQGGPPNPPSKGAVLFQDRPSTSWAAEVVTAEGPSKEAFPLLPSKTQPVTTKPLTVWHKGGPGGNTFAQVTAPKQPLHSVMSLAPIPALPDRDTTTHRGTPCIRFSDKEVEALASIDRFLLVGKFSHGQPKLEVIKKHFAAHFILRGTVIIGWRSPKHIFLKFSNSQDAIDMLLKEQITFNGIHPMRLFRWTKDFDLDTETSIALVWVLFHDLPYHYFNDKALALLCKPIGKYLGVDTATLEGTKPTYARVRIEMDLLKPLVSKVFVGTSTEIGKEDEGFLQLVEYEKIPFFCTHCRRQGHSVERCKFLEEYNAFEIRRKGKEHLQEPRQKQDRSKSRGRERSQSRGREEPKRVYVAKVSNPPSTDPISSLKSSIDALPVAKDPPTIHAPVSQNPMCNLIVPIPTVPDSPITNPSISMQKPTPPVVQNPPANPTQIPQPTLPNPLPEALTAKNPQPVPSMPMPMQTLPMQTPSSLQNQNLLHASTLMQNPSQSVTPAMPTPSHTQPMQNTPQIPSVNLQQPQSTQTQHPHLQTMQTLPMQPQNPIQPFPMQTPPSLPLFDRNASKNSSKNFIAEAVASYKSGLLSQVALLKILHEGPASTAVPPTFQPETPSGYSSEPEGKVGFKDLDDADIAVEEKGTSEERQCSSLIIVDCVANDDKVIANSAPPISRPIDLYGEIHFYPVDEQGYIIPVTKHDEDYRSMKVLKTRALELISNNWEADFKKVDYARHPALKEAMRWARRRF